MLTSITDGKIASSGSWIDVVRLGGEMVEEREGEMKVGKEEEEVGREEDEGGREDEGRSERTSMWMERRQGEKQVEEHLWASCTDLLVVVEDERIGGLEEWREIPRDEMEGERGGRGIVERRERGKQWHWEEVQVAHKTLLLLFELLKLLLLLLTVGGGKQKEELRGEGEEGERVKEEEGERGERGIGKEESRDKWEGMPISGTEEEEEEKEEVVVVARNLIWESTTELYKSNFDSFPK